MGGSTLFVIQNLSQPEQNESLSISSVLVDLELQDALRHI